MRLLCRESRRLTVRPMNYPAQPEDTTLSVLAHLSIFAFGLIGPLVLFLLVKDDPAKPRESYHYPFTLRLIS